MSAAPLSIFADKAFQGKVALITGAGSGIGRSTALAFARSGASVSCVDLAGDAARETAEMISSAGGVAIAARGDVTDWESTEAAFAQCDARLGGVDIVFNCAGIEGPLAEVQDTELDAWRRIVDVSLLGTFLGMRAAIPRLRSRGGGAIVNMSSCAGLVGVPFVVAYTSAKAGVIAATKTAALENATYGIRVNAVCPGGVRTPLMIEGRLKDLPDGEAQAAAYHPLGRIGEPEEIAGAVLWLSSPAASFVTGVALPVDGGFVVP